MSTTDYSTVTTIATSIGSTAPTTLPTNTTILIIWDYPYEGRADDYVLYSDGGTKKTF